MYSRSSALPSLPIARKAAVSSLEPNSPRGRAPVIIAVEGPSAVGKTTLVRQLQPAQVVSEDWEALGFPRGTWPDLHTAEGQRVGTTMVARRWELLLATERQFGTAVADTDPLKLYYDFALAAEGIMLHEVFENAFRHARQAMADRRLGFADHVVFLWAAPATLQARKAADSTRRRGNFATNLQLATWFAVYYDAMNQVRPGTVHRVNTDHASALAMSAVVNSLPLLPYARYDTAILDQLKHQLESRLVAAAGQQFEVVSRAARQLLPLDT